MGLDKLDTIRKQTSLIDWSAQVVPNATLKHLDDIAIKKARESFALKYANRFSQQEILEWSDKAFLDRAKLTQEGQITRTALILLGKPESSHLLLPYPAQMTWKLEGPERAYEHFEPPFLITSTVLYQKIRNIKIRILPAEELVAAEVAKYDQKVILEALHNCIAHQDYTRYGRIIITEQPDKLIFENEGSFFEGQPSDYVTGNKTPRRYRNPFLAQAMAELSMIDTMGYGIYEMHKEQAARYLPMPDYDLNEPSVVRMFIYGSIVDTAYSRLLMQQTKLPIEDVIALDRIQKKLPIDEEMIKHLRYEGLIEGRKPNLYISASVASLTSNKAEYIRTRAQDDDFYSKLLSDYLEKFGKASRKEISNLLLNKLSEGLNTEQKENKINNLLTNLRRTGIIRNTGSKKVPVWTLAEKIAE